MYFECFNSRVGSIYARVNCFMFGFLILIFGIQGICNLFNAAIQTQEYIKSYSIGLIGGGIVLIMFSFLKCGERNREMPYINL